jgi:hypothetical protein
MKEELIDIVCKLKEIKDAKDAYLESVPADLRFSVFDNKYVDLMDTTVQMLTDKVFEGFEEEIYWFLYEFEAGKTEGPHVIDHIGREWTFKSNKDYYEYLKGVE